MSRRWRLAFAVLALVAVSAPAQAQPASGPPNALQGFSQNRDKPVKIDAASLEVRDKDKVAIFSGSVQVVQGDTTLRCKSLSVFYDQEGGSALTAAQPGPGGQQRIRRLEARGGVIVTQKDQTATGETGIFDVKANTVTLTGSVVMTQGQNVLKGERLIVDLTTGISRVEGRVSGLILPSSANEQSDKGERNGRGAKDAPKRKSMHPAGLY